MKCNNCGLENADTNVFCINCGNSLKEQQPLEPEPMPTLNVNPVAEKVSWILKDKLFLALCILTSVATGVGIFGGNFDILGILFTIFLWLVYSKAKKNLVDVANMRNISGTIFANYVIGWVLFGCMAFLTIIIAAIGSAGSVYLDEILSEVDLGSLYDVLGSLSAGIFLVALVFVMIIVLAAILVSIFAFGAIHKFAKSLYVSVQTGVFNLEKVDTAKNWFLALGIIESLSALSNISDFWAFLSTGCSAAIYFIAYALIKKHFKPIIV